MKILIMGNLGYIGPVVAGHFRAVNPIKKGLGRHKRVNVLTPC